MFVWVFECEDGRGGNAHESSSEAGHLVAAHVSDYKLSRSTTLIIQNSTVNNPLFIFSPKRLKKRFVELKRSLGLTQGNLYSIPEYFFIQHTRWSENLENS